MSEGADKHHELYDEEEHQTSYLGGLILAKNGEVPRYPHKESGENLIGNLDNDVSRQEGNP